MEIGNIRGEKGFLRKKLLSLKCLRDSKAELLSRMLVSSPKLREVIRLANRDLGAVMFTFIVKDRLVE